jgi:glutamyl-tRNA synthetase
VFDTTKLEWMNGQYLSLLPVDELAAPVAAALEEMGVAVPDRAVLTRCIDAVKARSRTILDVARQVAARVDGTRVELDDMGRKLMDKLGPAYGRSLQRAVEALQEIPPADWSADRILEALKARAEAEGVKLGDALQPIRVALTGSTVSEPVNELVWVVGRDEVLRRLESFVKEVGGRK